ncbi:hypothetical protein WN51_06317 [Melipona quadrifasciata]|uniref:Uncharacterized protein n=1 Tax=Melipona quadrifasciata TaxID=166423 RepID=A0A0N0BCU4_9HYME|nr:hypothetical protein WN51_06317 [Melipona quadrifasciata]
MQACLVVEITANIPQIKQINIDVPGPEDIMLTWCGLRDMTLTISNLRAFILGDPRTGLLTIMILQSQTSILMTLKSNKSTRIDNYSAVQHIKSYFSSSRQILKLVKRSWRNSDAIIPRFAKVLRGVPKPPKFIRNYFYFDCYQNLQETYNL